MNIYDNNEMTKTEKRCAICGSNIDIHYFYEEWLCNKCYLEFVTICCHCNKLMWIGDNIGNDEMPLCENCLYSYYDMCSMCGKLIDYKYLCYIDEKPYCDECIRKI